MNYSAIPTFFTLCMNFVAVECASAQWQFSNHWISGKSLHYKNSETMFFICAKRMEHKKPWSLFFVSVQSTSFSEVVDVKLRINHRARFNNTMRREKHTKRQKINEVIHVGMGMYIKSAKKRSNEEEIVWRLHRKFSTSMEEFSLMETYYSLWNMWS